MRAQGRRVRPAASILLACLVIGAALTAGAPSSAAPSELQDSGRDGRGEEAAELPAHAVPVRLVTGEVLYVTETGDGTWAVVRVAGDRDAENAGAIVRYVDADGDLHVIPSDLVSLVGSVLDPRLFDVSGLIEHGYDLGSGRAVPVIVTFTGPEVAVPGVVVERRLPSIGAVAGTVNGVGARALRSALSVGAANGTGLAGVERISLDGAMRGSLDESAPPPRFENEVDKVDLTIDVIDRQGGDDLLGFGLVLGLDGGSFYEVPFGPGQPPVVLQVEPGDYSVMLHGSIVTEDAAELVVLARPEFSVVDDTTLVLDGRTAVEATYHLDAEPTNYAIDVGDTRATGDQAVSLVSSISERPELRTFALPTDPVTIGQFVHSTSWTALEPDTQYTLLFPEEGRIPSDLAYDLKEGDLAQVSATYSSDTAQEYNAGRTVLDRFRTGTGYLFPLEAPDSRVHRVTTEDQTSYGVALVAGDEFFVEFTRPEVRLRGGEKIEETWLSRPVRPGVTTDFHPPTRFGDVIQVGMAPYVDPAGSTGFNDPAFDTISFVLSADGEVLAESDQTFLDAEVPPELTSYELVLEVERDLPEWWQTSTATRSVWRFDSEHASEDEPLDLLQVDYAVELDPTNHTTTWPFEISFRPYNLADRATSAGNSTPSDITDLTAEWSTDEGTTWNDVQDLFEQDDGWWEGGIGVPRGCDDDCFVSLRISATDDGGAAMEQMITRAFRATYIEPTSTPTSPEPTLPPTGFGAANTVVVIAVLALLLGGLLVAVAAARLRRTQFRLDSEPER
jgi:hypothetical protein